MSETEGRTPFLVRRTPQLVALGYVLVAVGTTIEAINLVETSGPALALVGLAVLVLGTAASWWVPAAGIAGVAGGAVLVGASGWVPITEFGVGAVMAFVVAVRSRWTWRAPLVTVPAFYSAVALGEHMVVDQLGFVSAFAVAAAAAIGASLRVQSQYWASLVRSVSDAVATREIEGQRRVGEERLRIARDLHDAMGHQVAVAAMSLGVAEMQLPAGATRSRVALEEVREALQAVLAETQQILGVLRHPGEQEATLHPVPSMDRITDLLDSYEAIGLRIDAQLAPLPTGLDEVVSMTAYRVLQEALTNAHRYGSGTAVVRVESMPGSLEIVVQNARPATPPRSGGGYGVLGMQERIEAVGGRLTVEQEPDRFRVRAELPVRQRSST